MRILSSLVLLIAVLGAGAARAETEVPEGFTPLFNGQNLDGWHTFNPHAKLPADPEAREAALATMRGDKEKHWSVDGDAIVNDGHGAYLTTDKEYGDIELLIDYKTVPKSDSGIYLRGTPQVQIWDTTKAGGKWGIGADKGSGGLWNNSAGAPGKDPLVLADKPFGEWNRFRIIQVGARTTIYLNDELVVDNAIMENYWDRKSPLSPKGPILLQTHGGEISWRNLFVRELSPEESNAYLRKHRGDGFASVFNGKDFSGWAGPTQNYEVVDGSIVCQPAKGGTIYTEKEYGDFRVSFDFLVPPGGNNGLAIRYPGSGDTAYAGMCELQVLDNEHPKYKPLDPRQYHGSAYGMVAAARGFLRPAGVWNYQEVRVEGSRITVELNGNVILDTDLAEVTEYMGNRPHPGKDRTQGHFGFAGHGDAVQFRNVAIQEL